MTHHMVLGNICAKYEGNRSSGYEVMLQTWCDRHTHTYRKTDGHTAIIELPAAAKNSLVFAMYAWQSLRVAKPLEGTASMLSG